MGVEKGQATSNWQNLSSLTIAFSYSKENSSHDTNCRSTSAERPHVKSGESVKRGGLLSRTESHCFPV